MLAIRMQRTGRRGHAMFRVIVQDSRRTPTSGKVVARIGSYDPHNKAIILDKDKASFYLDHGAQPSDRVARLLKNEGVKLPDWVKLAADKERTVRNADKRRSTRPADATPPEPEAAADEKAEPVAEAETPAEKPETEAAETPEAESTEEAKPEEAAEPAAESTETPAEAPEAETETVPEAETSEESKPDEPEAAPAEEAKPAEAAETSAEDDKPA
jgi:small subunit ribosomal protein S16